VALVAAVDVVFLLVAACSGNHSFFADWELLHQVFRVMRLMYL
jgi:hypothetical protein